MSQEAFPGMPKKLTSASPSKLDSWLQCPRKFRFQYVDRPKPPGRMWAHQMLGISVHNALKEWWLLPIEKRTVESGISLLRASWRMEGFKDVEQSDRTLDRVEVWFGNYIKTLDPLDEPKRLEQTLSFITERLNVQGRIDRLDERDGEYVVVDYKTGRADLSEDAARQSMALAIYVQAVRKGLKKPCSQVELHHLPSGEIVSFRHTEETLNRQLERMEQIGRECGAAEIAVAEDPEKADEIFPTQTSALCGWCDYWQWCAPGQAAAAQKETWAGIDISSGEVEPGV